MLMEFIQHSAAISLNSPITRFHSQSSPHISVHDYLWRPTVHATLSPPILLSVVYYIDRLSAFFPLLTLSSLTVHRYLITSALLPARVLATLSEQTEFTSVYHGC